MALARTAGSGSFSAFSTNSVLWQWREKIRAAFDRSPGLFFVQSLGQHRQRAVAVRHFRKQGQDAQRQAFGRTFESPCQKHVEQIDSLFDSLCGLDRIFKGSHLRIQQHLEQLVFFLKQPNQQTRARRLTAIRHVLNSGALKRRRVAFQQSGELLSCVAVLVREALKQRCNCSDHRRHLEDFRAIPARQLPIPLIGRPAEKSTKRGRNSDCWVRAQV